MRKHLRSVEMVKCIVIPSGEGKSWICHKRPDLFFDADDLMDWENTHSEEQKLLTRQRFTELSNLYDRRIKNNASKIGGRIVLVSHPESCKASELLGIYLLKTETGIRYNKDNRKTLIENYKGITYYEAFRNRNEAMVELAERINSIKKIKQIKKTKIRAKQVLITCCIELIIIMMMIITPLTDISLMIISIGLIISMIRRISLIVRFERI